MLFDRGNNLGQSNNMLIINLLFFSFSRGNRNFLIIQTALNKLHFLLLNLLLSDGKGFFGHFIMVWSDIATNNVFP